MLRIHSNWQAFSTSRIYDAAVLLARNAILAWFLPDAIGLIAHCPGMQGYMAAQGAGRFSLDALHIPVDTSIPSQRLVRIFEWLRRDHGLPRTPWSRVPG